MDELGEVLESEAGVAGGIAIEGATLAVPSLELREAGVDEGGCDVFWLEYREHGDRAKTVPAG